MGAFLLVSSHMSVYSTPATSPSGWRYHSPGLHDRQPTGTRCHNGCSLVSLTTWHQELTWHPSSRDRDSLHPVHKKASSNASSTHDYVVSCLAIGQFTGQTTSSSRNSCLSATKHVSTNSPTKSHNYTTRMQVNARHVENMMTEMLFSINTMRILA